MICLSRLLLNLRDGANGNHTDSELAEQERSGMSTLDFSRFIGPLGNSLDDGMSRDERDTEEIDAQEDCEGNYADGEDATAPTGEEGGS